MLISQNWGNLSMINIKKRSRYVPNVPMKYLNMHKSSAQKSSNPANHPMH